MTHTGVSHVLRYAFDLARRWPRRRLTSVTKSNGIFIAMPYWNERVAKMAKEYPDVSVAKYHIDIRTVHFVRDSVSSMCRRQQPIRQQPLEPGPRLHRHHRPRPLGQPQPTEGGGVSRAFSSPSTAARLTSPDRA
ncbi:uncharacterized protein PG998_014702 [Apiospora kogelbergensis]|uniref:uncharacterized protein n=1 Tax=Apiospora kogelbergensis TaxID=1337665 RepID=UPI003130A735